MNRLDELKEVDQSCPTVDELFLDLTDLVGWRKADPLIADIETVRRINDELRRLAYSFRYDADAAEARLAEIRREAPELIARVRQAIDAGEYYANASCFVDARILLNQLERL